MARIYNKGVYYTNEKGKWRRIYKDKKGNEYIIWKKRKIKI